ncbi:MAG: YciI family protein [Actinomycetota bacterium]
MTDYLLLYSGGGMPETEEEQAAVMQAWNTWMEGLGTALKDGGNPFSPGAAKTVSADGSIRDGDGTATGYSIIQADSLDTATDLAEGCPVLQGGASLTVYETMDVM